MSRNKFPHKIQIYIYTRMDVFQFAFFHDSMMALINFIDSDGFERKSGNDDITSRNKFYDNFHTKIYHCSSVYIYMRICSVRARIQLLQKKSPVSTELCGEPVSFNWIFPPMIQYGETRQSGQCVWHACISVFETALNWNVDVVTSAQHSNNIETAIISVYSNHHLSMRIYKRFYAERRGVFTTFVMVINIQPNIDFFVVPSFWVSFKHVISVFFSLSHYSVSMRACVWQ